MPNVGRIEVARGLPPYLFTYNRQTLVNITLLVSKGIRNNCRALNRLDISHNKFGKDSQWNGLAELLQSPEHKFYELDISDTQVPISVLQQLLLINEGNVSVIAAENNLGVPGAKVLGEIAPKITCIDKINLADNSFGDQGLTLLVDGLCNNSSLTYLNVNNNFKESSEKNRSRMLHSFQLLSSSICPLEVLHFRGSHGRRVGPSIDTFIQALAANSNLTELDLTGQGFQDQGAMALGRLLQQNQILSHVFFDDNQVGAIGIYNVCDSVSLNKTLREMPVPFLDVAALLPALKDQAEKDKVTKMLAKWESMLSARS